jgi:hyperosmotically inducible protein
MVGMAATALLSSTSYAQTPATSSMTQSPATHAVATVKVPLTKKAARAANRDLAKRVQKIIYKTQGLNGSDIVVFATANTGQVTLSGSVLSEDQNRIATVAAGKVQGVTSVRSLLTLQEEGS